MSAVFGDDFVASAVKANGVTKWNMEIQRQWPANSIGFGNLVAIFGIAKAFV
jgi:hypothetical protein